MERYEALLLDCHPERSETKPALPVGRSKDLQNEAKDLSTSLRYGRDDISFTGKPDYTLVVGDVTSTMACSIAAKKLGVKIIHVEGGIRSNDLSMPEEINRMVNDSIADIFYTTSEVANENLRKLGHDESKIRYVGNTMIDTLLKNMPRFRKPDSWEKLGLKEKKLFRNDLAPPGQCG